MSIIVVGDIMISLAPVEGDGISLAEKVSREAMPVVVLRFSTIKEEAVVSETADTARLDDVM